jgi:hypothetical protein
MLDLHLARCEVEYIARLDENNKPVKDEWGRVDYTNEVKLDDEGRPKWKLLPFDLLVCSRNIKRYGLWCPEIENLGQAVFEFTEGVDEN